MKKRNKIGFVTILAGLTIAIGFNIYNNYADSIKSKSSYDEPIVVNNNLDTSIPFGNDFILNSNFSTHLPLVVINTEGAEIPSNSKWNEELKRFVSISGIEPYVDGSISVIDNGEINKLKDTPTNYSKIKIKRRGNSSMHYNKGQYLVKLVTESGQENGLSLLGMGEDNEWVLNGSMADKSMMRNYLGYRIASQIMPYTPDAKYCEVVTEENGKYKYEGVYLLIENIKQGTDRVNIASYQKSKSYSSYILRRDRFDEENIMIDTYESNSKLSDGYLGVVYPSKNNVTDETVDYIKNDIEKLEEVLYSDSYNIFSTYSDYIDVDSFINYALINEYFGNYDAGYHSTYMYKDIKGKLKMGPVWDYDQSIDNSRPDPMEIDKIAFIEAPWFKQLMRDPKFVEKLASRYAELRRNQLSDKNILKTIDEVQGYLGAAQRREWSRWEKAYYLGKTALPTYIDSDGDTIHRESKEYEQEIYKLKTVLSKHGQAISEELPKYKSDDIVKAEDKSIKNGLLIILFLGSFFTAIIYARRR
ncbi:CotH kinase family protein [Clostridium sp. SHJSY1]|uniref:CotH kinase family protein n=1 Tax=Clostridium sp. SHJSY1 TaxID=2942483 RepID=UPI0028766276|nr:CotH kinase family protein [Clostridium sp. SHJSY1]MDS0525434.1 CotH kinase family protein [Clostridium sp. SHJSY1]